MVIEIAVLNLSFMITYSLKDCNDLDPAIVIMVDPFKLHDFMSLMYGPLIGGVRSRVIDVQPRLDKGKYCSVINCITAFNVVLTPSDKCQYVS